MLCVAFSAAAFAPQTSLLHARPHHRMTSPLLVDTDEKPSGGFSLPTFFQPDVPEDQQAVSELTNLKAQFAGDWPSTDAYNGKLITLYAGLTLFISLPVSYTTFYVLPDEIPQLLIASNFGTFAAMLLFVLKLRLDWGGLSKRLASRTLYFEADQTGQQAKKDKATLMRDRLLNKDEAQPALDRINKSILTIFSALMLTFGSGEALTASLGEAGPYTLKTLYGDEARRYENLLRGDDEFARREQEKFQSRGGANGEIQPGYCNSRYYKILAGGNGQGGVGCN